MFMTRKKFLLFAEDELELDEDDAEAEWINRTMSPKAISDNKGPKGQLRLAVPVEDYCFWEDEKALAKRLTAARAGENNPTGVPTKSFKK